jgi:hypothetical protein
MILWRLHGVAADFVCSIEKTTNGYRLVVKGGPDTPVNQILPNVGQARFRALQLREELISMGFTPLT